MELIKRIKEQIYESVRKEKEQSILTDGDYRVLEFNEIVRVVKEDLNNIGNSNEEKIEILDSYLKILKLGIQYEMISDFIVKERASEMFYGYFPTWFKSKNGTTISLEPNKKTKINLKDVCLLTRPWNPQSFRNVVTRDESFRYMQGFHKISYFPLLGIAYVRSGFHSLMDGAVNRAEAWVEADTYDDIQCFENLYTDGVNWINKFDKSVEKRNGSLNPKDDVTLKFAVIFALTQKKLELEGRIEPCEDAGKIGCYDTVNEHLYRLNNHTNFCVSLKQEVIKDKQTNVVNVFLKRISDKKYWHLANVELSENSSDMLKRIGKNMEIPIDIDENVSKVANDLRRRIREYAIY